MKQKQHIIRLFKLSTDRIFKNAFQETCQAFAELCGQSPARQEVPSSGGAQQKETGSQGQMQEGHQVAIDHLRAEGVFIDWQVHQLMERRDLVRRKLMALEDKEETK